MPAQWNSGLRTPETPEVEHLLAAGCEQLGLSVTSEARQALSRYLAELSKWNRRMNLVGAAPVADLIEKHFLDSLTLLPLLQQEPPADLLDVGTGAGFPGLVLKIACPSLPVTLVEPRQKRVTFLKHVIRTLGLKEVQVTAIRLDESGKVSEPLPAVPYSFITSRALTEIGPFLRMVADSCASGGRVVCMKGGKGNTELEEWRRQAAGPFELAGRQEWQLPFSGASRMVLVFRKQEAGLCRDKGAGGTLQDSRLR